MCFWQFLHVTPSGFISKNRFTVLQRGHLKEVFFIIATINTRIAIIEINNGKVIIYLPSFIAIHFLPTMGAKFIQFRGGCSLT